MRRNLCYAQSGGVTAVINATAAGVFAAARGAAAAGKIFAARNGILGALHEELLEVWRESPAELRALAHTPGGAFGSCRVKIPALEDSGGERIYRRIFDVFEAHDIGYFIYNGGNDSADTTLKLAAAARRMNVALECVGAPKTIDNDLAVTDSCPGFGSAAKYVAVSVSEAALDVASMHRTSTKVFILEVMGRNAGWLAAAGGLPADLNGGAGMILFPEVPFNRAKFSAGVALRVKRHGYAVVTASEGLRGVDGGFLSAAGTADAFSHQQLGGVAPRLAAMIGEDLNLKCHWGVSDYLQRSARHIASETDVRQARALGEAAVKLAISGRGGTMAVLERTFGQSLPLAGWGGGLVAGGESGEEDAAPLYQPGRVWHHGGMPPLFVAADSGGGVSAFRAGRAAENGAVEEYFGEEETSGVGGVSGWGGRWRGCERIPLRHRSNLQRKTKNQPPRAIHSRGGTRGVGFCFFLWGLLRCRRGILSHVREWMAREG